MASLASPTCARQSLLRSARSVITLGFVGSSDTHSPLLLVWAIDPGIPRLATAESIEGFVHVQSYDGVRKFCSSLTLDCIGLGPLPDAEDHVNISSPPKMRRLSLYGEVVLKFGAAEISRPCCS